MGPGELTVIRAAYVPFFSTATSFDDLQVAAVERRYWSCSLTPCMFGVDVPWNVKAVPRWTLLALTPEPRSGG